MEFFIFVSVSEEGNHSVICYLYVNVSDLHLDNLKMKIK